MTPTEPSPLDKLILSALKKHKNVLLDGPPATGKSHHLASARYWFKVGAESIFGDNLKDPLPGGKWADYRNWVPSPEHKLRHVHQITFDQTTTHGDLVNGITPVLNGLPGYTLIEGPLLKAAREAREPGHTSLVTIDEMNRGPAVAIFGDTLTAIEANKRLDENGTVGINAVPFKAHDRTTFQKMDVYLPAHTYFLASINPADTSVEALDVAFLRRWYRIRILPNPEEARHWLGLGPGMREPGETPATPQDISETLIRAWETINDRIELAKGAAFALGHGIFYAEQPATAQEALEFACVCFNQIKTHIDELFFTNPEMLAAVLNAKGDTKHYKLNRKIFGNNEVARLQEPKIDPGNIYQILRSITTE